MQVRMHPKWLTLLEKEFEKSYFAELTDFVKKEYVSKTVFPHPKNLFRAFDLTPPDSLRAVILGQDPYHGVGQAHGLCFSVEKGVAVPPSLKNIYKEIKSDIGKMKDESGDLSHWAQQGVLLLNATLTVEKGRAGSHQGKGWEEFTDAVVAALNENYEHVVFMLWGNFAKQKGAHIDRAKHLVLESAHPSPFSASGFLGCRHFSKANEYLVAHGKKPIEW